MFLSLYVNVGTMYLLNFFGEWYIFNAVKALFCCGNCIVKANKNGQWFIYKQCNEQQSVLLSSFVVCYDYWNLLLFSHTK